MIGIDIMINNMLRAIIFISICNDLFWKEQKDSLIQGFIPEVVKIKWSLISRC